VNTLQVLAQHHIGSLGDLTAFSALPDAPVLAPRQRRFDRLRTVGAAQRSRRVSARALPAQPVSRIVRVAPARTTMLG
jgi:hypothetical protein